MNAPPNDPALIRRFQTTASGYWTGTTRRQAWALVLALAFITLAQIALQYRLNYWTRDVFDAVEQHDAQGLLWQTLLLAPLAAGAVALAVAAVYGRMTLQREWRSWLVQRLVGRWVKDGRSHRLNLIAGNHQVPEGRIADDARIATDAPVDFAVGVFSSCVSAATFIGILWVVGGTLTLPVGGVILRIPGYLVIAVILYSAIVTSVMLLVTRRFTAISEAIGQTEAELRYALTHVRENGERIAVLGSEPEERKGLKAALTVVVERWRQFCGQHLRLTVVSNANLLIAPALPLLLCMPRYLEGALSLGEVTQAAAAFVQVQAAFNWLVDNFARFATWRASARRVGALLLSLDSLRRDGQEHGPGQIRRTPCADTALRSRGLVVAFDDGRAWLEVGDLVVGRGERVRLVVDSDAGRAALLHAITGLADHGSGEISEAPALRRLVVSQHPFMPLGSLRRVIRYPLPTERDDDVRIIALLHAVGLAHLCGKLDEDAPWEQLLSSGERQRLGIVRACLVAPDLLLLDDPVSALDHASQRDLLKLLTDCLPDASILAVTQRGDPDPLFARTVHATVRHGEPAPASG